MTRNWKSASVGTSLALAAAAASLYSYARLHAAPTYHLANGVEVTPIEVQSDDVSRLLDAKIWKFDVVWPHRKGHFRVGISQYQDGKLAKTLLGGYGMGQPNGIEHSQITVGLAPMAGTIYGASEIKYMLSTGGSAGGTGTINNPFIHSHGYTQDAQVVPSQNLAVLMSGNLKKTWVSSPAALNETAIALEFTEDIPSK